MENQQPNGGEGKADNAQSPQTATPSEDDPPKPIPIDLIEPPVAAPQYDAFMRIVRR